MLVLLAVVPALGLTLYSGFETRKQASEKAQVDAMRLVRISADSLNDLITSCQQLLSGIALLPQVNQHQDNDCNPLFTSMLKEFPEYINLAAADAQGNIFCSGVPLPTPINIADRTYFQSVLSTGQFAVSGYTISRETHQSTVIMAHPSLDALGQVQAVVTASLDLSVLSQVISIAKIPSNSIFFVVDNKGTLLVRTPGPQQWLGINVSSSEIVRDILNRKSEGAVEASGLDNVKRLYAFTPVQTRSGNTAFLAIGFPISDVYAEANLLLERNLIYLGIVAILAIGAAWWFGDLLILRQITPLLQAANRWAAGDLHIQINMKSGPAEFMRLANAFDSMAEAIKKREENLRQAEREAVESANRIEIQKALIEQREKERLKIARDLHDGPVQEITGVTFSLYDVINNHCPPEIADDLIKIRDALKGQVTELRNYASELRPPALTNLSLASAVNLHIETYQSRHPELQVRFQVPPNEVEIPEETQIALFRIFQELMNNITKHAQASEVCVSLLETPAFVILEVRDNGVGFEATPDWLGLTRHGHLGLVGIKERAEAVGGKVEIESVSGEGTLVQVMVPCHLSHPDPDSA